MAQDNKNVEKTNAKKTSVDKASVEKTSKFKNYFRGVKAETKKIIWPNRETVINYTIVVLVISALVSGFVFLLDLLFNAGVTRLISM